MKITLIVLVIAIVVVGSGAMLVGPKLVSSLSGLRPETDKTEVRTQLMSSQTLIEVVSAPGEIEPLVKVNISSEVSARIEELPFREGDEVRKGDLIVKLDDRDLQAALKSAQARRDSEDFRLRSEEARLAGLFSNLSFAARELERKQSLFDTGDVSQKSLDDAQQSADDLDANVEAAKHTISVIESTRAALEANIARAEDALANTVIHSPMDGVITMLEMEVGEQVLGTLNNMGTEIMTIADLTRMILKADIAESDIAAVAVDQKARVHINAYPDLVFDGVVARIALQRTISLEGAGVFKAEIEIDLAGHALRSGHAANVDIEIQTHKGYVVESQAIVERLLEDIPNEIRLNNDLIDRTKRTVSVVYLLIDGKSVCTPVLTGSSDLTRTLILAGVHDDDVAIIGPYKVLEDIKDDEDYIDENDVIKKETVVDKSATNNAQAKKNGNGGA